MKNKEAVEPYCIYSDIDVKKYYVDLPEHWLFSSARNRILEKNDILEIDDYD